LHWRNGRRNSNRLLTPEEVDSWSIERNVHGKPTGSTSGIVAGPRSVPSSSPHVPPDQQKRLDALSLGRCDLSEKILAGFEALAAPKVFPPEAVADMAERFLQRAGKKEVDGVYCWNIRTSVPAFLLGCALNIEHKDDNEALVHAYLDWRDHRDKKNARLDQQVAIETLAAHKRKPSESTSGRLKTSWNALAAEDPLRSEIQSALEASMHAGTQSERALVLDWLRGQLMPLKDRPNDVVAMAKCDCCDNLVLMDVEPQRSG